MDIKFQVREPTFNQLSDELLDLEERLGSSSIGLFRAWLQGDLHDNDETAQDWLSKFFLWLGTSEVKRLR